MNAYNRIESFVNIMTQLNFDCKQNVYNRLSRKHIPNLLLDDYNSARYIHSVEGSYKDLNINCFKYFQQNQLFYKTISIKDILAYSLLLHNDNPKYSNEQVCLNFNKCKCRYKSCHFRVFDTFSIHYLKPNHFKLIIYGKHKYTKFNHDISISFHINNGLLDGKYKVCIDDNTILKETFINGFGETVPWNIIINCPSTIIDNHTYIDIRDTLDNNKIIKYEGFQYSVESIKTLSFDDILFVFQS